MAAPARTGSIGPFPDGINSEDGRD